MVISFIIEKHLNGEATIKTKGKKRKIFNFTFLHVGVRANHN